MIAAAGVAGRRCKHPFVNTGGGSFAAPDILNNVSFDVDWGGMQNDAGGTPSGPALSRSADRAYDGTTSAKIAWTAANTAGDLGTLLMYNMGADKTHVFARCWFYIVTNWPDGSGFKFLRFQGAGLNSLSGGMQVLNGNFAWLDNGGNAIFCGAVPSTDVWHSIEFEHDRTSRVVRCWVDGSARTWTSTWQDPSNHYTRNGTDLNYDVGTPCTDPHYLDICRVINPTSNSGSVYFDRIAISTQRIGP